MNKTTVLWAALAGTLMLGVAGCDNKGPAEKVGEKLDNSAENVADAAKDVKEEIKEAAHDVKEEVQK